MAEVSRDMPGRVDRYFLLDGMRGVVAILVALMHFSLEFGGRQNMLAAHAYCAVDFFFVLSGLVIARAYERKLRSGMSFRAFMMIRLVRLYPLFAIGLLLGLAKQLVGVVMHRPETLPPVQMAVAVIFNSMMLPDFSGKIATLNGPSWSLTLELLANIAFGAFLYRLSLRSLCLAAAVAGVSLAAAIVIYGSGNIGWSVSTLPGGLARVFFAFIVGMIVSRISPASARPSAVSLLLLLPLCLLLRHPPTGLRVASDLTFDLLLFPALIFAGARLDVPARLRPACSFLGGISYPLYILHVPFIALAATVLHHLHIGFWPAVCAYLATLIAIAATAEKLYDERVRAWLSRRLKLRGSTPQIAQAAVTLPPVEPKLQTI